MSLNENLTAISAGNLTQLKSNLPHSRPDNFDLLIWRAADDGQLAILEFLLEINNLKSPKPSWGAAANGRLDCLKLLYESGYPMDRGTTYNAASNGHLDCLVYAHESGCAWDGLVTNGAYLNNHPDCLLFAFIHGCPISGDAERRAIELAWEHNDNVFLKKTASNKRPISEVLPETTPQSSKRIRCT